MRAIQQQCCGFCTIERKSRGKEKMLRTCWEAKKQSITVPVSLGHKLYEILAWKGCKKGGSAFSFQLRIWIHRHCNRQPLAAANGNLWEQWSTQGHDESMKELMTAFKHGLVQKGGLGSCSPCTPGLCRCNQESRKRGSRDLVERQRCNRHGHSAKFLYNISISLTSTLHPTACILNSMLIHFYHSQA